MSLILGYICQEHNNPPDFFLDLINGDPTTFAPNGLSADKEIECDLDTPQSQHEKLVEGFKTSAWNKRLQEEADDIMRTFEAYGGLKGKQHKAVDYITSFGHQV
ncbi:unnamed protein product, partial [Lymnaea stagnalis]